ncbi:hypothetical protein ES705_23703 [subsurface metagenome]
MKEEEPLYCQWCSKQILGKHFGAMFNFDLDGQFKKPEKAFKMFIEFDDMLLHVIFPGNDSPPDIRDDDVLLVCCSQECADNLNREVKKRKDILEVLCRIRIEGFYKDRK